MTGDPQISEIFELFGKFGLDHLRDDWVINIIDSDFTEVENLPAGFEEIHTATNFSALFQAQISALRSWVDSLPLPNKSEDQHLSMCSVNTSLNSVADKDDENQEVVNSFWVEFSQVVKMKSLMGLICYYVNTGQHYDAKQEDRDLASYASSLYFLILCVPGSNAFRVFHPVLYLKALDILRLATKLNVAASSPKKCEFKCVNKYFAEYQLYRHF